MCVWAHVTFDHKNYMSMVLVTIITFDQKSSCLCEIVLIVTRMIIVYKQSHNKIGYDKIPLAVLVISIVP